MRQRQTRTIYASAVKQCFASAPEKHDLRQRRKSVFCVSARKARFTSAVRNSLTSVATYPQSTSRAGRKGDVGGSVATNAGRAAKTRKHELRQRQKNRIYVSVVTVFCVSARKVRFTSTPQNSVLRQRPKSMIYVGAVKQRVAPALEKHDLRQRRKTVFCVSARKARFTSAP